MRRILFLVTGLLYSLVTTAQVASPTQFGVIKIGAGLSVDANGFVSATATGGTSVTSVQSVRDAWPVVTVADPTLANVQAAINAASTTGTHIKLAGVTRTISGGALTINKPIYLEALPGFTWLRSDGSQMIFINGVCPKLRITGLTLINLWTGSGLPVLASNELAKLTDVEIDNNYITCPNGDFNAMGIVQYSAQNVAGSQISSNILLHDNRIASTGRMGLEILAQSTSTTTIYITNLRVFRNYYEDLGRVNTDGHGMAVSIDGAIDQVLCDSNTVVNSNNKSLEFVNCKNVVVRGNKVRNTKNPNVTGVAQSSGNWPKTYSILVEGNDVETTAAPYIFYDAQDIKVFKNRGINTVSAVPSTNNGLQLTRITNGQVQANTIIGAGFHATMLENSTGLVVTGNLFSTEYNPNQVQVIYFYGSSCTGNIVQGNRMAKQPGAGNPLYVNEEGGATGNTYTNNDIITQGLVYQPVSGTGIVLKLDGQSPTGTSYIVDTSPIPKIVNKWATPVVSTTQFKYGSSSLYFNGSSGLSIPSSNDFNFGAGSFTMEGFIYPTAGGTFRTIATKRNNNGANTGFLVLLFDDGTIRFFASSNGTSWDITSGTSFGTPALNAWSHWAVSRSGNNWYFFLNGVQNATFSSASAIVSNNDPLVVGGDLVGLPYTGYMHLKITKGQGLYTAGFTPPTTF